MKTTWIATLGVTGLAGLFLVSPLYASEEGTSIAPPVPDSKLPPGPKPFIQFETNFFDFGRLDAPGKVAGSFNFKNTGDAMLKVDPPEPSCGCTDAKVTPDTLAPGQAGMISYTISLDHAMGQVQKHITVHSNDPRTPDVKLTMQLDYTPLYDLDPAVLQITVPPGQQELKKTVTINRGDAQPVNITRLVSSKDWITAEIDNSAAPDPGTAKIEVTIHRPNPNPPSTVSGEIEIWATNHTDRPMQTLQVSSDFKGELSASPARIYWVFPDFGDSLTNYSVESLTRTVELKSALGNPIEIKNATTNIKGMSVHVTPKEGGKSFDLVLKFDELPSGLIHGNVAVETSLASLPRVEVPVVVTAPPR